MLQIKRYINLQNFKMFDLPFCQVGIIFTHLKLWIASVRRNLKWVKIQINYFGGISCFAGNMESADGHHW